MEPINRRDFLGVATAVCACALCGGIAGAEETSSTAAAKAPAGPVDIGAATEFAKEGVYDKWAQGNGFFVINSGKRIFAVACTCTHKGGHIVHKADWPTELHCTKHKGVFHLDGTVISGPPKEPLSHFAISKSADGHLHVDSSKRITKTEWEQKAAYVTV
jgi:nitrite reductase/ring-hydroxylating ferredoxin subunit